jgi:hypothetical protein
MSRLFSIGTPPPNAGGRVITQACPRSLARPLRRIILLVVAQIVAQLFGFSNTQAMEDDGLRIYAVNVVKTPPFQKEFIGYGIYLGQGFVITAAHVVGHWVFLTRPRVLIAGLDLPAKVLKNGSPEHIDLALLLLDETQLPVSLRLRRNPLCKTPPLVGMEVIDVIPERTSRSRIISPLLIEPSLRNTFDALIDDVKMSGSGIFDAQRRCLLGIVSAKVLKYKNQMRDKHVIYTPDGFAGYFVSATKISEFLPEDLHL